MVGKRKTSNIAEGVNESRNQHGERGDRLGRQAAVGVLDQGDQPRRIRRALRHHQPELTHVPAQCVDELRPLTNQKVAGAKGHRRRLAVLALDGHKPHRGPLRRLARRASASAASLFWRLTKGLT